MPELRELVETVRAETRPVPGAWEEQQRRQRRMARNRRIGAISLTAAVAVIAALIVLSRSEVTERTQTPAVPGGTETGPTPIPPAGTYLIDLNTGEKGPLPRSITGSGYSVSPDGTMVTYVSRDDAGTPQVFMASLDGTDVQQVTHDQRGVSAPDWSPDGEAIAYTSGDPYTSGGEDVSNIFVLDLATGETSQVTNEKPTSETNISVGLGLGAAFPQFSPDGASIIYEVNRGNGFSVRVVPITGGKSVLLVGGGKKDIEAELPSLSPDGSTLAVACYGRLEGICIADAEGTNLRALVSGPLRSYPKWSPDGTRIAYIDKASGLKVFVVDVATRETTFVAEGFADGWLDDHTLIVEHPPEGSAGP